MRNTIGRIVVSDGHILTSFPDINREAANHFETFLKGQNYNPIRASLEVLSELIVHQCSREDAARLMRPVQAAELKEILFAMPCNKAPGPDGFPMKFYKASWSVIEKDFFTAVQFFFIYGFMPKSINATLLSLVPKTTDAETMSYFRPISCYNVIYKVIFKLLESRLKATLPEAIELNQCAFVEGRLLLENVLLATELVEDYHKPLVSSRVAIKLDISKAFDTISWTFIEDTLCAIKYPDFFCYMDHAVHRHNIFLGLS